MLPTSIRQTFSSLADHHYRYFWGSSLALHTGIQVHTIAQQWLLYDLTRSGSSLGLTGGAAGVPLLVFSLLGGALADRFGNRRMIIVTQLGLAVVGTTLGTLILTGQVQPWHIVTLAACTGTLFAFNGPGRQAAVADLVEPRYLLNAVSLNAGAMNLSRTLGPALAGMVIDRLGIALTYFLYPLSTIVSALLLVPLPRLGQPGRRRPVLHELREGLVYARGNRRVVSQLCLGLAGAALLFGYLILLPMIARDILDVGISGLGLMAAAMGVGALVGSIGGAALAEFGSKDRLVILAGLAASGLLAILALAQSLLAVLGALLFLGAANQVFLSTNQTIVQMAVPDWVRGRVLGLWMTTMAVQPLSWLPVGILADLVGVRATLFMLSLGMVLATGVVVVRFPASRRDAVSYPSGHQDA